MFDEINLQKVNTHLVAIKWQVRILAFHVLHLEEDRRL